MDPPTLPPSSSSQTALGSDVERVPGIIVVLAAGEPAARAMTLTSGAVELGRGDGSPGKLDDGRISRRHAVVRLEGERWWVTDLGSQNGTFVDGKRAGAHVATPVDRVVRAGDSLVVPCADVRPFERSGVRSVDGFVRGPTMEAVLAQAAGAAQLGTTLHIQGESGTGKEGVAQAFHRAGHSPGGALVAVNCAAIPHAIAERLLFGARRGAYSGAEADAAGYVQEADGGTLFLDEIAELDLQVQAKLLRVLESREVLPLGASKPRRVELALCSATSKDLRALVAAGTLREDLYFRVGRPAVLVPPRRNRPEEIPALIAFELARLAPALTAHVSLIEQCLLRAWPGNVRELLAEVRSAAQAALPHGDRVTARHLAATAGSVFGGAPAAHRQARAHAPGGPDDDERSPTEGPRRRTPKLDDQWRRRIEDALRANAGNVTAAARALGLHRTQLRRLVARLGLTLDRGADDTQDD